MGENYCTFDLSKSMWRSDRALGSRLQNVFLLTMPGAPPIIPFSSMRFAQTVGDSIGSLKIIWGFDWTRKPFTACSYPKNVRRSQACAQSFEHVTARFCPQNVWYAAHIIRPFCFKRVAQTVGENCCSLDICESIVTPRSAITKVAASFHTQNVWRAAQ